MRPPAVCRAAALAGVLLALVACGSGEDERAAASVVEGTIVSLEYDAGRLRSFTLTDVEGETHEISVADDVSYGFDLDHLREHRAAGEPVRCDVEERDGKLVALTIEDA